MSITRYNYHIAQATTSSLGQLCTQLGGYLATLHMLQVTMGERDNKEEMQGIIDNFTFSSLWLSCVGSVLSLISGQYLSFTTQHGDSLTIGQR